MVDTTRIRNSKALTVACLSGAAVLVGMLNFQSNSQSYFESSSDPSSLRNANNNKQLAIGAPSLKIPASLDSETQRRLSLNLGGGNCQWEPPEYDVPTDIKFFKTLIAGFPSCDKRMTFTQMEALTGWAARDEWDFVFEGYVVLCLNDRCRSYYVYVYVCLLNNSHILPISIYRIIPISISTQGK